MTLTVGFCKIGVHNKDIIILPRLHLRYYKPNLYIIYISSVAREGPRPPPRDARLPPYRNFENCLV